MTESLSIEPAELAQISQQLEGESPTRRIEWAAERFPEQVVMSSSFGAQAAVSLHQVNQVIPGIPVILTDTGYLFPETYEFIEELKNRLDLNLKIFRNPLSPEEQEAKFGKLWEQGIKGIEHYNQMNKVEPMSRALDDLGASAWLAGLRRQQSSTRAELPVVVSQRGRIKIHPIVDWTDKDVFEHLRKFNLPYHPLWEKGYVSIGDWHTSRQLTDGMSEEDTRFFGLKRECGLHEDVDFAI